MMKQKEIDRMKKELGIKYELIDKNGNPQCVNCGKAYKPAKDRISGKVSKYLWKPRCDCLMNPNLRLAIA